MKYMILNSLLSQFKTSLSWYIDAHKESLTSKDLSLLIDLKNYIHFILLKFKEEESKRD